MVAFAPVRLPPLHGIAGIIGSAAAPAPAESLPRMVGRMCHDASRVPGYCGFAPLGVHVGWVAPRARESREIPVGGQAGTVTLILAGEGFAPDLGTSPASASPGAAASTAAAVAQDYERHGSAALLHLNGACSGLIFDRRDDTVTLFNDRYGLERVYYHPSAEGFYFASEAKALLDVLPHLRRIDPRGLAEQFSLGCVLQNRSLFPGIAVLPPGSAWRFHRDGRIEHNRYFDPGVWEQQEPLSPAAYHEQLCDVFVRLGRRHVADGARIALSLTGGLDSRAVLAWSGSEPGALPCYTFGGPYRDCADVVIARRLARLCGHPHTTIRIGQDFFAGFAGLAEQAVYLSDGTMDVSGAVELYVNRQAREIAPVRLTGNYGSEILRAHIAFRPGRTDRSLFTPEFNRLLDEAAVTYRAEAACHRLTFIAFKQLPWHHQARFAVEKSQLTPRSPFLDHELVALAYRAPGELGTSPTALLNLIAQGNPRLAAIGTDRALRRRHLPVVSQVAQAWQEFTAKAEYAYDYGMPRWLARADRALTRLHLEKLFLGRHKFYHFRVWYRDQLRAAVRDRALASGPGAAAGCYRTGVPRQLVDEHLSGRVNRTRELHQLLSVQAVDRLLLRQP